MSSQVKDDTAMVDDTAIPEDSAARSKDSPTDKGKEIPLFRGRSRAKEFRAQLDDLRGRVDHLGLLSAIELEQRKATLERETEELAATLAREKAESVAAVERETAGARERAEKSIADLTVRQQTLEQRVSELNDQVVVTEETAILPTERVRELGDASVPFKYDTHALVFSDDAVGLEAKMHERLANRRVNRVNKRREFFYITPGEAKTHLLALAGDLLEYVEVPEAVEYRQSVNEAEAAGEPAAPAVQLPTLEADALLQQTIPDAGAPIPDEDEPLGSRLSESPSSQESMEL